MIKTVSTASQNSGVACALPISVIMVSYMTGPVLYEAIASALADEDIAELIIVDNGNPKQARAKLAALAHSDARVRLLQGHGNIGFASGCNYGAQLSTGHYLLFVNPDALIKTGSARDMAICGAQQAVPWITGGLLRDVNGNEQRGARRGALTPISAFMGFTGLNKVFKSVSIHRETLPMPRGPVPMQTISGALLMMDRASFEAVGGFNEAYFLHVEDIDICRRVRLAGGSVCFVPSASVMHYGSTSRASRMRVEYEKLKGFLYYFWTYKPGFMSKFLTVLAAPMISVAILGRAALLIMRQAIGKT